MKKALFSLALALMTAVLYAPAALADDAYTPIPGGEVTLDEYLVMDKDTPVPDVTLGFSLASGTAVAETDDTVAVLAEPEGIRFKAGSGVTVNPDGSASLSFSSADAAVAEEEAPSGDAVAFDSTATDDEKYVKKVLTVDLSQVSFNDVGVYRYVLTQSASDDRHLTTDNNTKRYLDVYITDDDGDLQMAAVLWRTDSGAQGKEESDLSSVKSSGMTSRAYRKSALAVEKAVTGNQGSRDQYFAFTVKLTGTSAAALDGDSLFTVSGSFDTEPETNMATVYTTEEMQEANAVNGTLTYAELTAGKTFYLRHGQRLVIGNISEGLGYIVTEAEADGYTASCAVTGDTSGTASGNSASDDELTGDTALVFTNTREGVIPTGVVLRLLLPALLALAGLAGLAAVVLRRRAAA